MDRAKRVRYIKKSIITAIICLILLPTILCVVLFVRFRTVEKELLRIREENAVQLSDLSEEEEKIRDMQEKLDSQEAELTQLRALSDRTQEQIETVSREYNSDTEDENRSGWPKKVYLTFDDGPSGHTQEILDILDAYGVKGNFFVCATHKDDYLKFYKEILSRGHMLGLHSYTHEYDKIYASQEAFEEDVSAIRDFVREQTDGFVATYYRFPGGSSNLQSRISLASCEDWLEEQGLIYYDWNISTQDATNPMQAAETILHNATYGCDEFEEVVILMHDLGNKDSTVEALPKIIEFYQDLGVEISVIDENSKRIQHDK